MTFKDFFYYGVLLLPTLVTLIVTLRYILRSAVSARAPERECEGSSEPAQQNSKSSSPSHTQQSFRVTGEWSSGTCEHSLPATDETTLMDSHGPRSGSSNSKNEERPTCISSEPTESNTQSLQSGGMKSLEAETHNILRQEPASKHYAADGTGLASTPRSTR